jgi:hypothetical protein
MSSNNDKIVDDAFKKYQNAVMALANKFGEKTVREMKDILQMVLPVKSFSGAAKGNIKASKIASGRLFKSIKYSIRNNTNFVIMMEPYGKAVDEGTPPGRSVRIGIQNDKQSLLDWMSNKGIPRNKYVLIKKSIYTLGIAPRPFRFKIKENFDLFKTEVKKIKIK